MSNFDPDNPMDVFVKRVPVDVMIELGTKKLSSNEGKTSSDISKKLGITYTHVIRVVNELEDRGMLETEKKGRKKVIELTDKGKEISDILRNLENTLEN